MAKKNRHKKTTHQWSAKHYTEN